MIKKASCRTVKNEIISNKEKSKKLHKAVIRKVEKKSTLTFYRQYLGGRSGRYALISKFNIELGFFYFVLLIFIGNMDRLFL